MSRTILIILGLATIPGLVPLEAQDWNADDLRMLNFNIGGGLSIPLNPTGRYVGVNGSAVAGAGANFDRQNSIEGDFMWNGLSPSVALVRPTNAPFGSVNVYSLTGEYRFQHER